jgi:anion-transporting  ArsA/GET3 family ATPase
VNELTTLLDKHRLAVVCGAGGVGKTTVAAALGVGVAARCERRVLVLTVDPARRLATALGLDRALGNEPVRVDQPGKGQLWVAMLDTKQSWDDLVRRHAPDRKTRDAILSNPLYQNLTGKFVAAHDYIAAERLHELDATGEWDLIVIDTPPSRHALDFLQAPARMAEFFGSRLLRWLTVPYRSKVFNLASRPFLAIADRTLGAQFLSDIAEFFILFQTMEAGFVTRARAVDRTLRSEGTSFVVITTLEPLPAREAEGFANALRGRGFRLGALVANRALPGQLLDGAVEKAAEQLRGRLDELGDEVVRQLDRDATPEDVRRLLSEVLAGYGYMHQGATRQVALANRLRPLAPVFVTAPVLDRDVTDLEGLEELSRSLESKQAGRVGVN